MDFNDDPKKKSKGTPNTTGVKKPSFDPNQSYEELDENGIPINKKKSESSTLNAMTGITDMLMSAPPKSEGLSGIATVGNAVPYIAKEKGDIEKGLSTVSMMLSEYPRSKGAALTGIKTVAFNIPNELTYDFDENGVPIKNRMRSSTIDGISSVAKAIKKPAFDPNRPYDELDEFGIPIRKPVDVSLSEERRSRLDGIVQQMQANNESEEDIQFVVDDFKNKYGQPGQKPPDEVQQYYNYLKQAGADLPPDVESFKRTMSDSATANQYYNYLKANNFDAPDNFESFSSTLGFKKQDPGFAMDGLSIVSKILPLTSSSSAKQSKGIEPLKEDPRFKFDPKQIEDYNREFEDVTGHKEFSLSEPEEDDSLLGRELNKKRKTNFEQEKYDKYRVQEKEILNVQGAVQTGTTTPQELTDLYEKPYGKKILGQLIRDLYPEVSPTQFEKEVFLNEELWHDLSTRVNMTNRANGVAMQDQHLAEIDKEFQTIADDYDLVDFEKGDVGARDGGSTTTRRELPRFFFNDLESYPALLEKLNNADYVVRKGDNSRADKDDIIRKVKTKLAFLVSQEPIDAEIEGMSDVISTAVYRQNMAREQGETIPTGQYAVNDKKNEEHFKTGLNFMRFADPTLYKNVMRGLSEKGVIADSDFRNISMEGQRINNNQIFRGAASDPRLINGETDLDYKTKQDKKSEIAGIIGERLKKAGFKNVREFTEKQIRSAGADLNPAIVKELAIEEKILGYDAIPKSGGVEAIVRGIMQPIGGLKNTVKSLFESPAETYLRSKKFDTGIGGQLVPDAKGRLGQRLASDRGRIWYTALEGLGQFVPQILLTKGIGGAMTKAAGSIAGAIPGRALTAAQGSKLSLYGGTGVSVFMQTYGDAYADALKKTGDPKLSQLIGTIDGVTTAAWEMLLPDAKIADDLFNGLKRGLTRDLTDLIKQGGNVANLARTSRPFVQKFANNVLKIWGKETAEEVGTTFTDFVTESIFSPKTAKDRNIQQELIDTTKTAAISTFLPAFFGGFGVSVKNDFTIDGLHSAAINLDDYKDSLDRSLINDQISEEEHKMAIDLLTRHRTNIENAPEVNVNGEKIDGKAQMEYAYQQTVSQVNTEMLETDRIKSDKVLTESIKKKRDAAEQVKREIFNGKADEVVPVETEVEEVTTPSITPALPTMEQNEQSQSSQELSTIPQDTTPSVPSNIEQAQEQATVSSNTEQNVTSSATPRIPVAPIPGQKPKNLSAILNDVSKGLKQKLFFSKPGASKVIGTYSPGSTAVKIRNASDLDTAAHELGHAIDDKVGFTKKASQEVQKELQSFLIYGSKPPKGHPNPQKYEMAEGFAEWLRAYIVNPDEAKQSAPHTFALYDQLLGTMNAKKTIDQFSNDVRILAGATGKDVILSNIEMEPEKKTLMSKVMDMFRKDDGFSITFGDRLSANFLNPLRPFDKAFEYARELQDQEKPLPENDPMILARLLLGFEGKYGEMLKTGILNARHEVIKDYQGNPKTLKWLLEPLKNETEATIEEDMGEVTAYMVAERTVELASKFDRNDIITGIGAGLFTDVEVAEKALHQFDQMPKEKQQRIQKAADRYRSFANDILQYLVDKGRMSEKQYERIIADNVQYVALNRILETEPNQEIEVYRQKKRSIGSSATPVYEIAGSARKIQNPYSSLLDTLHKSMREADRNEVLRSFRDVLVNDRGMNEGDPVPLAEIGVRVKQGEPNTIPIFVKGSVEHWKFEPAIFKALKGYDSDGWRFHPLLTAHARILRWCVTHWPVFAARNWVRDFQDRLIKSNDNSNLSGFTNIWGKKTDWSELARAGGLNAGYYMRDRTHYYGLQKQVIKELAKDGKTTIIDAISFKNGIKAYENMLFAGETSNRVAEYRSAFNKARKDGYDKFNASLYAASKSRNLIDFAVMGHYMKLINQVVPFSNAAVQGLRSSFIRAKENPKGFAARMALYTVVPQIGLWFLNHRDDEEAKQYENLPWHQRDMAWNFKVGDNQWVSIPKPFELSLVSAGVDRLMSHLAGNEDAFKGYGGTIARSFIPIDESALGGSFLPFVEMMSNYDFFKNKSIVPNHENVLNLELRNNESSSRLGHFLQSKLGIDARKIDHFMQSQFSYFGDAAIKLSNIGDDSKRTNFGLPDVGFIKGSPAYNSPTVGAFLDYCKEWKLTSRTPYKHVMKIAGQYFDSKSDADKERYGKELIETAKMYLNMMKKENMADQIIEKHNRKKELEE